MSKKGVAKGIDPRIEGEKNDIAGLSWVDAFGWIRRAELSRLIWPNNKFSARYTSRLAEKWLKKSYVLERELPDHGGKAIVLAKNGVDFLESHSISAKSGKDLGKFVEKLTEIDGEAVIDQAWIPSISWKHELLAAGFLTLQHEKGGRKIIPERQIRRENQGVKKIPDGIIILENGKKYFLEIEHSKKSGVDLKQLTNSVIQVAAGEFSVISGHKPDGIIVSFVKNATDTRGFKVDHKERLVNSIKKTSEIDVDVYFAEMKLSGIAPISYTIQKETILNDAVSRIQNAIDSTGWKMVGDKQKNNWNENDLTVTKDGGWLVAYNDGRVFAGKAANVSLAKRKIAEKIKELLDGPIFNSDDL